MLENAVLFVHIIIGLAIVGLILLQQGKGSEMGASFGAGASQTVFGASGSGNFFSRLTAIFATIFFVTSFSLAVIAKKQSVADIDLGLPSLEESSVSEMMVEESDIPVVESAPASDAALPEVPEAEITE